MANTVKEVSLKCIKWDVKASSSSTTLSETFSFQGVPSTLELNVGAYDGYNCTSRLYFKSSRALPSPVTVFAKRNSYILTAQTTSISRENEDIWTYSGNSLKGDTLTFEIIYSDNSKKDASLQTSFYIDTKFQLEGISNDLSSLFDEGSNHDVEFTCSDQIIKAHKNVLCCRSKVFASMLQSDMIEGKSGKVNIQDMEGSIFKKFLKCLYSGVLPELSHDTAMQCYEASDKYAVDGMKKQCSNYLVENITPENACEILILADRHDDSDFKKDVMQYMIREKIPLMGEMWINFCNENFKLANEVLNLFCQHLSVKPS